MAYSAYHLIAGGTSPLGQITQMGVLVGSRGSGNSRNLKSYAVVYTLEGHAKFRRQGGPEILLTPGDLMFLFPGVVHTYGPATKARWSEFFIVFDGPIFDLWCREGVLDHRRPVVHLEPIPHWLKKMESVSSREGGRSSFTPLEEICSLQRVLAELIAHPLQTEVSEWEVDARALLETHLDQEIDLRSIARTVGVSYTNFRTQFAMKHGQSPGRYRTSCRINAACQLLGDPSLSKRDIAERLGFANQFHFSRRFKQFTGKTPTEFRRTLPQRA